MSEEVKLCFSLHKTACLIQGPHTPPRQSRSSHFDDDASRIWCLEKVSRKHSSGQAESLTEKLQIVCLCSARETWRIFMFSLIWIFLCVTLYLTLTVCYAAFFLHERGMALTNLTLATIVRSICQAGVSKVIGSTGFQ
jgi:hypothetical protein